MTTLRPVQRALTTVFWGTLLGLLAGLAGGLTCVILYLLEFVNP